MSTHPSTQSGWEILEDHFRGKIWYLGEHRLSDGDARRCANALTLWCLSILDIAPCHDLERSFSIANLIRWSGQREIDVKRLLDDCKSILAVIRDYDPFMGKSNFKSYKLFLVSSLSSNFVFELLRPLCYRLYGGNAVVFRDLNTILQFWSRLTLRDVDWVEQDNLASYYALEEEMRGWQYPETLLDCLRYIVSDWFSGFTLDGAEPDFSNGATAEVKRGQGVAEKVKKGKRTISQSLADAEISFNSPYFTGFSVTEDLRAKVQLVPKGIDKKRVISMEPTVNQYYQYALFKRLDEWFDTHRFMKIDLRNQDLSRDLALEGSRMRNYSTIDITNASDTVTWTLVKSLFRDAPEVLRYVSLVRTPAVIMPDGNTIAIEKFTPMGSSICFPFECIVFSAVASYSCMISGIPQNYRVYGDDIVIDARAYNACVETLGRLHFEVNVDKSFGPTSIFLEACGIEAYNGNDVSPCRLSRKFDIVKLADGVSPQQLEGAMELCNRFYAYGLFKTRKYLIHSIMSVYKDIPFSVDPERGIYHPNPSINQYQTRFKPRKANEPWYQSVEVKVLLPQSRTTPGDEYVRYLRTLEKTQHRDRPITPDTRVEVACGTTRGSLKRKWVTWAELVS